MLANSRRYASAAFFSLLTVVTVAAQNPQLQEKVAQIKQGMAANKKLLAQYTWQEQQTVSLKGKVKEQQSFQVRMGARRKAAENANRTSRPARRSQWRPSEASDSREENRGIQGLRPTDR
jgi:hypothetical protein